MIKDLIANHIKRGMTALEAYRLLGEPDWRDGGGIWRYALDGDYSLESNNGESLELRFDSSGALLSTTVTLE